jgi:hypothetical protein
MVAYTIMKLNVLQQKFDFKMKMKIQTAVLSTVQFSREQDLVYKDSY